MFGFKKEKDVIVTFDETGKIIETKRDIIKELGPLPVPVPDELPPLEKEREDFLIIVEALDRINTTLSKLLDKPKPQQPAAQPIATPPKNKGGRPKGFSPKKKIVVEEV